MKRTILVKNNDLSMFFTLDGINNIQVIKTFTVGNIDVVIDSSFEYDITPNFPKYVVDLYKIIDNYTKGRFEKVAEYNTRYIYNKAVDSTIINDIAILLRKDNYKKADIPYPLEDGKIKIAQQVNEDVLKNNTIDPSDMIEQYRKIRTIVFNTTILPYVRNLLR